MTLDEIADAIQEGLMRHNYKLADHLARSAAEAVSEAAERLPLKAGKRAKTGATPHAVSATPGGEGEER